MIDVAAQNAFSLAKMTNDPQNDVLRLRQNWLEKLGLDLITENTKDRYDRADKENLLGRSLKHRENLEEFLAKVQF
jgi:hypothetical protein